MRVPDDPGAVAGFGCEDLFAAADVDHGALPAGARGAGFGEPEKLVAFGGREEVVYCCGEEVFVFWEWGVGF